jgi:hypothetical protein
MSDDSTDIFYGQGSYAVYRGVIFRAVPASRGTTVLKSGNLADYLSIADADALERSEKPDRGAWSAVVPDRVLDRKFSVGIKARWFGEFVSIAGDPDPELGLVQVNYRIDPAFAVPMEMIGSQSDGWQTWVPVSELEDVVRTEGDDPLVVDS